MAIKPTYEELAQRVKELEKEALDRKRAEEALRESEENLRALFESSHDYIFSKDREGRYVALNQNTAVGLGGTRVEDIIGKTDHDLMPKDLADALRKTDKWIMETGEDIETEELVNAGENMIYTLSHKCPVYDKDGRVIGITGYAMDITERKQAEEALALSEKNYKDLVEKQILMIHRYLPDTTDLFVNQAFTEFFGKEKDEMVGSKWINLVPEDEQTSLLSHLSALTPSNPHSEYENKAFDSQGDLKWTHWINTAFFNEEGKITHFQSVGTDITERKQADEALHKERNRAQTYLDIAGVMFVAINPDLASMRD